MLNVRTSSHKSSHIPVKLSKMRVIFIFLILRLVVFFAPLFVLLYLGMHPLYSLIVASAVGLTASYLFLTRLRTRAIGDYLDLRAAHLKKLRDERGTQP